MPDHVITSSNTAVGPTVLAQVLIHEGTHALHAASPEWAEASVRPAGIESSNVDESRDGASAPCPPIPTR